ncbi:hypothetical protein BJX62DRAFT_237131 [Aspergillus germanicus]
MSSNYPHWPGGIPREIQIDAHDFTQAQALEESKGWVLFVQEQWVPRAMANNVPDEAIEYELRQRRALVERWVKASQEFRDSYHQRAPSSTTGHELPKDALQDAHYPKKPLPHF